MLLYDESSLPPLPKQNPQEAAAMRLGMLNHCFAPRPIAAFLGQFPMAHRRPLLDLGWRVSIYRYSRIFTWMNMQPVTSRMYGSAGDLDGRIPVAIATMELQVMVEEWRVRACVRLMPSRNSSKTLDVVFCRYPYPPCTRRRCFTKAFVSCASVPQCGQITHGILL